MNPDQIRAWISVGAILIEAGEMTIERFKAMLQLFHPHMTDAQLNAILDDLATDAKRRAIISRIEAARTS